MTFLEKLSFSISKKYCAVLIMHTGLFFDVSGGLAIVKQSLNKYRSMVLNLQWFLSEW